VGQALENKGPGGYITEGATPDAYTVSTSMLTNPTLSSGSATGTTTSWTGSITSDVSKGFIAWAVVPDGQTIAAADWLDIVLQRIDTTRIQPSTGVVYPGNALEYGTSTKVGTSAHSLAGAATLTGLTNYDLVILHMNGWSQRSALTKLDFATT